MKVKKFIIFLVIFLLCLGLVSPVGYTTKEKTTAIQTNYSTVNVNNSQFLLGSTWETNTYRPLWYNHTLIVDRSGLDYILDSLTLFNLTGSVKGNLDLLADNWTLTGTNLMVNRYPEDENASIRINSGINQYSCLKLTDGGFGFEICNDGAGTNTFFIRNSRTKNLYLSIDRDDGEIIFFNTTTFNEPITFEGSEYIYNQTSIFDTYRPLWINYSLISSYVPYTGANKNVVLGANNFSVDTNVFFVDSNGDKAGFGTSTPDEKIHVIGNIKIGETAEFVRYVLLFNAYYASPTNVPNKIVLYSPDQRYGFGLSPSTVDYHSTVSHNFWADVNSVIKMSATAIKLPNDNGKIYLGGGSDASIYYDGTNMLINPKEVGSGILDVAGTLQTDGYNSADGTAGLTQGPATLVSDVRMNGAQLQKKTITVTHKNGLLTAVGAESDWTDTTDV
jgi:hypothetical protein